MKDEDLESQSDILLFSIYQTSEYPFSHALIGYSSSGYPVIFTGLQNKMAPFSAEFWPIKLIFFVTSYSLVWYLLRHLFPSFR